VIPGGGHLPSMERPEEATAELVSAFLDREDNL
jgi:pimeloyl-ACP methyl ester carboxylesterase